MEYARGKPSQEVGEHMLSAEQRAYLDQFAGQYASTLEVHRTIGNSYGDAPGAWTNVGDHCLVVGIIADIIAEKAGFSASERTKLVEGGLLHDYNKPEEKAMMKADPLSLELLDQISEHNLAKLRAFGVPEEVLVLTDSSVAPSLDGHADPLKRILYYADAIVTGTDIVPLQQRFDDLERGWTGSAINVERAKENAAFSEAYRPKYGGKSLYDVQRELGARVEAEIAGLIGFDGDPVDLPDHLEALFQERVLAAALVK